MFTIQRKVNLSAGLVFLTLLINHSVMALPDLIDDKKQSRSLYVEGELLMRPKKGYSISSAKQFISASGDIVAHQVDNKGLMLVKLAKSDTVKAAMARYKATSAYELVQPNFRYYATATSNDTDYGNLWGLKNTGQAIPSSSYSANNPGIAGNDIDAELAWDLQSDCSSKVVAVIDTGINYRHSDLIDNVWVNAGETVGNATDDDGNGVIDDVYGFDAIDNDGDPMSTDGQTHGTHVAGTIGATGNNTNGISGVCQKAKIMSIRVLGTDGGSTLSVVQGVNYAVANGAKVINMSLGGGGFDTSFNDAITNAGDNDVVVVVAAGNDGVDTNSSAAYPCNYAQSNLICVAALDQAYDLASFSNFGVTHVDVGAPGTNIYSSYPGVLTAFDDFTTGWTGISTFGTPDTWVPSTCDLGTIYNTLVNPGNQCGTYATYNANQNDTAYKTFDLNGILGAGLKYGARVRTNDSTDKLTAVSKGAGGDPTAGGTSGTAIFGDKGTSWYGYGADLSGCLTNTCTVGFNFTSDVTGGTGVSEGISIIAMQIQKVTTGATTYKSINGTSMASPHAAGVAALVYSYNPTYTAVEVATAIKNSGESIASLATTTTTGRALNAFNALRYIQTPTGVTAVVQ